MFAFGAHPPRTLITRAALCDLKPFWYKVWFCPGKKRKNADLTFITSLFVKFEMSTPEGCLFTCFLSAKCYLRLNKRQQTLWTADKYLCDASQLTNGLNNKKEKKKNDSLLCAALAHTLAHQWVISTTSAVSGPNQTAGNPKGLFLLKTNSTPQCIHLIKGRDEQLPSTKKSKKTIPLHFLSNFTVTADTRYQSHSDLRRAVKLTRPFSTSQVLDVLLINKAFTATCHCFAATNKPLNLTTA